MSNEALAQIKELCHTLDRGVGYRVSGDHSTWDSYTEGKSDFAGEVLELIDKLTIKAEAQRLGLADDEMVQALNIGGRILAHKMTEQEIDDAILHVYQARLDARAGQ